MLADSHGARRLRNTAPAAVQANAQKGDSGHLEVMQAYEYVLGRLGHDSDAAPIWKEFLDFLAGFPPTSSAFRLLFSPEPGKEASKRALRLRDVYQKALLVRRGTCTSCAFIEPG